MGKRLIVAEKPAVGRDIAKVLGCREKGAGCQIGDTDIVTWAIGHLVTLCYPDELDPAYQEWSISTLPIIPDEIFLKPIESGKKQFEILKDLMNSPEVDRIVCATDAGREGELIFRYIYQMAGCTKPVERLWISSLTFSAIKKGFENLNPASDYDDLYESARCRAEADWLIGMNGSRAYAIVNDMRRLSVGRVQSPTLAILVQRALERRNFVPEEYYELAADFSGINAKMLNEQLAETAVHPTRFPATEETKKALEVFILNNQNGKAVVKTAEETEESVPAQLLYDLTSLQRDANRLYGIPSKTTLDVAQSLYEKYKAITYPRTDSRFLSSDLASTLQKRLESLEQTEWSAGVEEAKASQKDLFGRFINNKGVSDHHAIIPTGEAKQIETWTKYERLVYGLIANRFVGMFLPDAVVIHQEYELQLGENSFIAGGDIVVVEGWSAVDKSRRLENTPQKRCRAGEFYNVTNLRVRHDQTTPPPHHTDASLLLAMEHAGTYAEEDADVQETEYGIGTPATRAATIETLITKEMVVRKGRTLQPTEYGVKLISILPEYLTRPDMTGQWEATLTKISKGIGNPRTFRRGINDLTEQLVAYALEKGNTGIKNANSVGRCPLCGNMVREYENSYYCVKKACGFRKI